MTRCAWRKTRLRGYRKVGIDYFCIFRWISGFDILEESGTCLGAWKACQIFIHTWGPMLQVKYWWGDKAMAQYRGHLWGTRGRRRTSLTQQCTFIAASIYLIAASIQYDRYILEPSTYQNTPRICIDHQNTICLKHMFSSIWNCWNHPRSW